MSIIGRTNLIPHFVHRKEKRRKKVSDPKVMVKYDKRAAMLSKLGYANYKAYLASDDWKAIRGRVLAAWPTCLMCTAPSAVVHHVKYWDSVLLGLDDRRLAALCHKCHESIEVGPRGKKLSLGAANHVMFEAARRTEHGMRWFREYQNQGGKRKGPKGRC